METNKLKLLHVVEAMGGGVFTYLVDLSNELVEEFDIYIAYAKRSQTPDDFQRYFDPRIDLIEVKNFGRDINPLKEFKAIKEVKDIAKEIQPDIIHLHSSKAGVIGRIAFNGSDIPLFYTPHGYSYLMRNYNLFKRTLFKLIEKTMALSKCVTISCGKGEHRETLRLTKRAEYINNGINLDVLANNLEKITVEDHPFTVYTLGRICTQKNPKLFNQIASALPEIRFMWIGDGELRNELTAENIEITGWIEREEALQKSMNGDAFLLPSLWEGLPISLLESMYMKQPCVVSRVIGNNDVIRNHENGYVCSEVEEFVDAIQDIQAGNATAYVEKAYEDIQTMYNMKTQAVKYIALYKEYVNK